MTNTAALLACLLLSAAPLAQELKIADFHRDNLDQWQRHEFSGVTLYQLKQLDGQAALIASSRQTASGLIKKQRIDLQRTPFLNWQWRVEQPLPPLPERSKAGDDYAARIYVIIDGGFFFWKTRALNYVWSSQQARGSTWPNAFTDNAHMLAVRNNRSGSGQWFSEKRNVREDLQRVFGKDFRYIDAIALMTDTDNSGGVAEAAYGKIFFSSD